MRFTDVWLKIPFPFVLPTPPPNVVTQKHCKPEIDRPKLYFFLFTVHTQADTKFGLFHCLRVSRNFTGLLPCPPVWSVILQTSCPAPPPNPPHTRSRSYRSLQPELFSKMLIWPHVFLPMALQRLLTAFNRESKSTSIAYRAHHDVWSAPASLAWSPASNTYKTTLQQPRESLIWRATQWRHVFPQATISSALLPPLHLWVPVYPSRTSRLP